ncbi:hypothetical protein BH20CHL1_BH20CHL1_05940 [soil metagenome]|jgi:hypothetical protein
MEAMAEAYAPHDVSSIFVYVREAHPGEHYPHHQSIEDKLDRAREFQRIFDCRRPILVDDLCGAAHRAFGGLPNMTCIINQAHTITFRSDWTDAPTVRFALDYLLDAQERRRQGEKLAPFYAELMGFRSRDEAAFDRALERNGPKAVSEMQAARELWARGEHLSAVQRKRG